jgi:hypothetical protein
LVAFVADAQDNVGANAILVAAEAGLLFVVQLGIGGGAAVVNDVTLEEHPVAEPSAFLGTTYQ